VPATRLAASHHSPSSFPIRAMFFSLLATASALPNSFMAQSSATNSYSWGIVIFCVVVGLVVALKSSRRTTEVKRPRQE
jgi:hypothetical protein